MASIIEEISIEGGGFFRFQKSDIVSDVGNMILFKWRTQEDGQKSLSVLENVDNIKLITIYGQAQITEIDPEILSKNLSVNIVGTGGVYLPQMKFEKLRIMISGGGFVKGDTNSVDNIFINLIGYGGNVMGLHVVQTGVINVTGSGNVDITSENPRSVVTSKVGLGNITIR